MKRILLAIAVFSLFLSACNNTEEKKTDATLANNPLIMEFDTPFQVPPFDKIKEAHYLPAFNEGIAQHKKEIEAIVANPEEATFENTIEAMEKSGKLLNQVSNIFFNLLSATTNDKMQKIAQEVSPLLSSHGDDIALNADLFAKVKAVYDKKDELALEGEKAVLLEETYKGFVRNGANLNDEDQAKLREINTELSTLSLQFGENVLKETNGFEMLLETEEDLAGLPEAVVSAAADAANANGYEGKWLFSIQKPSMIPFLTYSEKRELREKIFNAYTNKGDNKNELDNNEIVAKLVQLRIKRSNLLGFETHADYILAENMAKNPAGALDLLNKLWNAALPMAKAEAKELQKMIDKEGGKFELAAWDWWYYSEKLRKEKYDLDDETLRPYFELNNVRNGAFAVATKLYGITFEERTDIPVYHEEAVVYEVKEADGTHIGLLYQDFHPRASKRGGAWMTSYRKQSAGITPVISMVMNFSRPTGGKPALLSFDETTTLFHEFGHALHGLLSQCNYNSLSGTSVARDFVELPSQIMENWAGDPEVMKEYAKHYETDEVIPDELIEKIKNSGHFNQGFTTIEYLAASFLDLSYHALKDAEGLNVAEFETKTLGDLGLISEIVVRYRSTYFNHIFAGGYSAGYYAYVWAEVLDADAYAAFKESGDIYNKEKAAAFRDNVLAQGRTKDPMELYRAFRGQDPSIEPLLERKGLK